MYSKLTTFAGLLALAAASPLSTTPVSSSLAARDLTTTSQMTLCIDFNGTGDNCKLFDIPSAAFGPGFEVDQAAFTSILGGAASAATVNTPGIVCGFTSSVDSKLSGFILDPSTVQTSSCGGTKITVEQVDGQKNFPDGLNDNFACLVCAVLSTS